MMTFKSIVGAQNHTTTNTNTHGHNQRLYEKPCACNDIAHNNQPDYSGHNELILFAVAHLYVKIW
jgi:hypothetical protein